mmetsp:Transcript_28605/g.86431  ORF Transcript_28605/g.86431 Transcript_28605/m.86431 type:complete len:227 (+) Transcript_28605:387-1067(+)
MSGGASLSDAGVRRAAFSTRSGSTRSSSVAYCKMRPSRPQTPSCLMASSTNIRSPRNSSAAMCNAYALCLKHRRTKARFARNAEGANLRAATFWATAAYATSSVACKFSEAYSKARPHCLTAASTTSASDRNASDANRRAVPVRCTAAITSCRSPRNRWWINSRQLPLISTTCRAKAVSASKSSGANRSAKAPPEWFGWSTAMAAAKTMRSPHKSESAYSMARTLR